LYNINPNPFAINPYTNKESTTIRDLLYENHIKDKKKRVFFINLLTTKVYILEFPHELIWEARIKEEKWLKTNISKESQETKKQRESRSSDDEATKK